MLGMPNMCRPSCSACPGSRGTDRAPPEALPLTFGGRRSLHPEPPTTARSRPLRRNPEDHGVTTARSSNKTPPDRPTTPATGREPKYMADWEQEIELTLTREDHEWARAVADAKTERIAQGDAADHDLANTFWSPYESRLYSYIAEAGMVRYAGKSNQLRPPAEAAAWQTDGGVDIPGLPCEVKCAPWLKIEHFHLVHGGRLVVPLRRYYQPDHSFVLCSYLTRSRRLFFAGYATSAMIRDAPRGRYRKITTAEIRYADLLPPQHWPHRLAAVDAAAGP